LVLAGCADPPPPVEGEIRAVLPSGIEAVAAAAYEAMSGYPGRLKEMRVIVDNHRVMPDALTSGSVILLSGLINPGAMAYDYMAEREIRVRLERLSEAQTGIFMRAGLDTMSQKVYNVTRRNLGYEDWQVY